MGAQQVEAVVPAAEHGAALQQEQGVVHTQRQAHAGARQRHSCSRGVACWLTGSLWTLISPLGTSCMVSEPWPSLPPLPWPQVSTWPPRVRKPEWNFCRTTLEMLTASLRKLSTMSGCSLKVAGQFSQTISPEECHLFVLFPRPRLKLELVPHT